MKQIITKRCAAVKFENAGIIAVISAWRKDTGL
jgi:hypothetical protein